MTHIEAMKQALEALEYFSDTSPTMAGKAHAEDAITALRTAIEQAEKQEPVAWAVHYKGPIPLFTKTKSEAEAWGGNKIVPLYTTPPAVPVQEPVACQHKRYSVDVHEQTGTCYDCGAEGRMRFVVGDATSPTAPVQEK